MLQNKVLRTLALPTTLLLALSGCQTATIPTYQTRTANTLALTEKITSQHKAKVGEVTSSVSLPTEMLCRLTGPVAFPTGTSPTEYIKEALVKEMIASGVYNAESQNNINLEIQKISFKSYRLPTPAHWVLKAKVFGKHYPEGFIVETKYNFTTSYIAEYACQNAAQAFVPAVQSLISAILAKPEFIKLIA